MTRKEYLNLAKASVAFQSMDGELQREILKAQGEDLQAFTKIFLDEEHDTIDTKKNFMVAMAEVIETFEWDFKKMLTTYHKKLEEHSMDDDEKIQEKLLAAIKKT